MAESDNRRRDQEPHVGFEEPRDVSLGAQEAQGGFDAFSRRKALGLAAVGGACLVVPSVGLAAEPPSIDSVIKVMDELYRAESSYTKMRLVVKKPGKDDRAIEMESWTSGLDTAVIKILSPKKDKGTGFLKYEKKSKSGKVTKKLLNYIPKIGRTIGIAPSAMLSSWMGSDFTNDDLVREASYQKDYDASWGARSTSPAGWTLVLTAKPGMVGLWKKIEMVLNDAGTLPLVAKYYDRKGRLGRTMYFEDVKQLGGRTVPTKMRLVPTDKPDQSTEIIYLQAKFNIDVPKSRFSIQFLEQG